MKQKPDIYAFTRRIETLTIVRTVRSGLVNLIPVLYIGAFALIGKTLPLVGYQRFLATGAGGVLLQLFDLVYSATFGVLSLYMTYAISRAYMKLRADAEAVHGGAVVSSLLTFFILSGAYQPDYGTDGMGPKSMFLAILAGLGASSLYLAISRRILQRRYVYSSGADREFNRVLGTVPPVALTAACFAGCNLAVMRAFGVGSLREGIANLFNLLFSHGAAGFGKGFCFVLLSSVLWFFGIHGSDTLEGVMQTYFAPGLAANQAAVASGVAPSAVLTKEFFDCFVLMGGCGATICLLITILLFSHNRARKNLGLAAALPMLFNINEMMVFGLPIILNPAMLIPFLAVPLACYSVAYAAISLGLVPMITGEVTWTTPILLGGFRATGSVAGAALQLANVTLGVLIYLPFVRLLDAQSEAMARQNHRAFLDYFITHEQELNAVRLTELNTVNGEFARGLCAELRHGLERGITMGYQPQYRYDGRCVGVEALLRWEHPVHGVLYPPLVFKLAKEGGFLAELEEAVIDRVLRDRPKVLERFGADVKLSFNVTGDTVTTPRFLQFCRARNASEPFAGKNLCIEITEQAALALNDETMRTLSALRELGFTLAIDDFSMGSTSIHYLKDNLFGLVKLDGSLVRGLFTHSNSRAIVASIVQLSASLNVTVLAEYVETEEQREALHEVGCDCYQGYLYSPAVFL